MNIDINLITQATGGEVLNQAQTQFAGVGTDTRSDLRGKLFIPLKGENFDAHNFIDAAIKSGASGILTAEPEKSKNVPSSVTQIKVLDTLKALQDLAREVRKNWGGPVVALTGSNGKTTTKFYLHQILNSWHKSHVGLGSFNNHWGVPMTILDIPNDAKSAIIEMGMNHKGEIEKLCSIAEPNIVGVLNVGRAHLGHFKNVEEIAQSKAEIYQKKDYVTNMIFNLDNIHTKKMYEKLKSFKKNKTISNESAEADVFLNARWGSKGLNFKGHINGLEGEIETSLWGLQNAGNVAFAAVAASLVGMPNDKIWHAMSNLKESWGRNQFFIHDDINFLFDGYNANPESFLSLFENLKNYSKTYSKQLVGVFGDMKEMGEFSVSVHQEVARTMSKLPFKHVFYLGEMNKIVESELLKNNFSGTFYGKEKYDLSLSVELKKVLNPQSFVVLKASRGIKIEKIINEIGIQF